MCRFPATPANLANFGQAVNFPLIFGLVLVLFGAATLMHLLLVSVARAGAGPAQGPRVHSPPGGVLGLVAGHRRRTCRDHRRHAPRGRRWQADLAILATNLGVVPAPVVIAWVIAAVALGTVLAANALAIGPFTDRRTIPPRRVSGPNEAGGPGLRRQPAPAPRQVRGKADP